MLLITARVQSLNQNQHHQTATAKPYLPLPLKMLTLQQRRWCLMENHQSTLMGRATPTCWRADSLSTRSYCPLRQSTSTTSRLSYTWVNLILSQWQCDHCHDFWSLKVIAQFLVQSYYDAMDPEEGTSLPLRLRDKRHIVFGNLLEIYKFHETLAFHCWTKAGWIMTDSCLNVCHIMQCIQKGTGAIWRSPCKHWRMLYQTCK